MDMEIIELELDAALFSSDVVARTAHRYSAEYYVELAVDGAVHRVRLTPRRSDVKTDHLLKRFHTDACDDRLRERVWQQTGELYTVLMRAALIQASPETAT